MGLNIQAESTVNTVPNKSREQNKLCLEIIIKGKTKFRVLDGEERELQYDAVLLQFVLGVHPALGYLIRIFSTVKPKGGTTMWLYYKI